MAVQFNWLYVGGGTALGKSGYGLGTYNDPWNPLGLPPFTARFKFEIDINPPGRIGLGGTWTEVGDGVWDYTHETTDWTREFTGIPDYDGTDKYVHLLGFNSTGITNFTELFYSAGSLKTVCLFDTRAVTSMAEMFDGCRMMLTVPLFDTSNVTNMRYMFSNCHALTHVPLFDTRNVTTMEGMFVSVQNVAEFPLFDTRNVTTMEWMFESANGIVPALNTSRVTNMKSMFGWFFGASIPLLDTSNVTNMISFCNHAQYLTSIPLFDTSSVTNMYHAFYFCPRVESGALALYNQASSQAVPPSNHENTFFDCGRDTVSGRADLAQIPADWGGDAA